MTAAAGSLGVELPAAEAMVTPPTVGATATPIAATVKRRVSWLPLFVGGASKSGYILTAVRAPGGA
jgi:hypothetical protein